MVLFINCCPRAESRTKRLAGAILDRLGEYETINLYDEPIVPLDEERLSYRTNLIEKGDYTDKIFGYAKQFQSAEYIVIAAPYWDLSFPAQLKVYLENIYVTGIVSRYNEQGMPEGMCNAKKLYYVTTAGGPYCEKYSYDYIKDMAINFFGIKEAELVKAQMLDIVGNDAEAILAEAIEQYK